MLPSVAVARKAIAADKKRVGLASAITVRCGVCGAANAKAWSAVSTDEARDQIEFATGQIGPAEPYWIPGPDGRRRTWVGITTGADRLFATTTRFPFPPEPGYHGHDRIECRRCHTQWPDDDTVTRLLFNAEATGARELTLPRIATRAKSG